MAQAVKIAKANPPWTVCLSAAPMVRGGDKVYAQFPTRRSALILARLALFPGRSISRNELCRLIWPDDIPEATRSLLRSELARLRGALGEAADVVLADRDSVWLNQDLATTDLIDMAAALNGAIQAVDPTERLSGYASAAAIDCSQILAAYDQEWVVRERERYRNYARLARLGLGRVNAESGDVDAALSAYESAIELQSAHEEAYVAAMSLLMETNRSGDAHALYERLSRELAVRDLPGPSEVARAVLSRESRAEARQAAQLSNLPSSLSPIVGREEELREIQYWLDPNESGQGRLLTLTGPGGIGKTRLSIEAGRLMLNAFEQRVWFVDLADQTDPQAILGSTLETIQGDAYHGPDEQLALRSELAGRPVLLILDNFEQLVDGGAQIVAKLLKAIGELRLIVTSRQRLNVEGEREFDVRPLGVESNDSEGVRLFMQVAAGVYSRFPTDDATRETVRLIAERLEGIPLAIHLAAARCDVLSPRELLDQLDHRFDVLVRGRADLPKRHQKLADTIDWSYRLLTPELQDFLADLSVFRGGWTLESASRVLERPDTIASLEGLRARSFVFSELEPGGMRFRMLETIREFAASKLVATRGKDVRKRHFEYFTALARTASEHFTRPTEAQWFERLEADFDNIMEAFAWADANDPDSALRICRYLWRFWCMRCHHREARRMMGRVLAKAWPITEETGWVLFGAARISNDRFEVKEAFTRYGQALAVFEQLGQPAQIALVQANLAALHNDQGDHSRAQALATAAYEYFVSVDRAQASTHALDEMAKAKLGLGDLEGALADALRTHEIRRQGWDDMYLADAELLVGAVQMQLGALEEARARFESALGIYQMNRHHLFAGTLSCHLAEIDLDAGRREKARERVTTAEAAFNLAGAPHGPVLAGLVKTRVLTAEYEMERALTEIRKAIRASASLGAEARTLDCLDQACLTLAASGASERAAKLLVVVDAVRTSMGRPRLPIQRREADRLRGSLEGVLGKSKFPDSDHLAGGADLASAVTAGLSACDPGSRGATTDTPK